MRLLWEEVGGAWVQGYRMVGGGRGRASGGRGLGARLLYQVGGAGAQGCIRWEGPGYEAAISGGRGHPGYCIRWEGPGYKATVGGGGRDLGMRLLYQVGGAWV